MVTSAGKLQGVWADLLMPLNEDLSINNAKLYTHVQTLAAKGVYGLVLFGRCGEGAAFSPVERMELVKFLIVKGVAGTDILLNASSANMPDTLNLIRKTHSLGVQSFMLMPPLADPDATDQGLVDYFSFIVRNLNGLNVRLYLSSLASPGQADLNARAINTLPMPLVEDDVMTVMYLSTASSGNVNLAELNSDRLFTARLRLKNRGLGVMENGALSCPMSVRSPTSGGEFRQRSVG